jgi:hypothetical protein
MDDGSVVAFGLILMIGMAVYTLIRHRRHPDFARYCFTITAFWALLMLVVCPPLYFRAIGGQSIVRIVVISSLCFALTFVTLPSRRTTLLLPLLSYVLMVFLIIFTNMLVHGGGYTATSRPFDQMNRYKASQRNLQVYLNEVAKRDTRSYPAGWLSTMPFDKGFSSAYVHYRGTPQPCWHSWFTGLYRAGAMQVELWYPGGTIRDAIRRLEFRPR